MNQFRQSNELIAMPIPNKSPEQDGLVARLAINQIKGRILRSARKLAGNLPAGAEERLLKSIVEDRRSIERLKADLPTSRLRIHNN